MRQFMLSALAVCLFAPPVLPQVDPRALVITVIDIGQGDSILIEFPEYGDATPRLFPERNQRSRCPLESNGDKLDAIEFPIICQGRASPVHKEGFR